MACESKWVKLNGNPKCPKILKGAALHHIVLYTILPTDYKFIRVATKVPVARVIWTA